MRVLTGFDPWIVTLKSGREAVVWAGGYTEAEGMYEFSIYVELQEDDAGIGEPSIVMRTPSNPARVSVAVARIPIDDVDRIMSG